MLIKIQRNVYRGEPTKQIQSSMTNHVKVIPLVEGKNKEIIGNKQNVTAREFNSNRSTTLATTNTINSNLRSISLRQTVC